jgi:hypothetical protein
MTSSMAFVVLIASALLVVDVIATAYASSRIVFWWPQSLVVGPWSSRVVCNLVVVAALDMCLAEAAAPCKSCYTVLSNVG